MGSLAGRLKAAKALARHPCIRVLDLEDRLGTRFTADTVAALRRNLPHIHFVWLMGADNLYQISQWQHWTEIFRCLPIAVFARPTYCHKALAGLAARRFAHHRIGAGAAHLLAGLDPPAWVFLPVRLDPHSATAIRSRRRRAAGPEPQTGTR
jgi:nicotinate-nucleotide adenylyltransferase